MMVNLSVITPYFLFALSALKILPSFIVSLSCSLPIFGFNFFDEIPAWISHHQLHFIILFYRYIDLFFSGSFHVSLFRNIINFEGANRFINASPYLWDTFLDRNGFVRLLFSPLWNFKWARLLLLCIF